MRSSANLITIIGLVAGFLTTVSFVPQVLHVWKTRSTHDLSLVMFLLFIAGVIFWLIYGILTHAWPVILANGVTLVLGLIILGFKLRYK